jgi:histidinol-phosphatase
MSEIQEITRIAHEGLDRARKLIQEYYSQNLQVEFKADKSPVTIADQKAEELLREFFLKETPGCGLIGEEHGIENPGADLVWIMDPIDGTKSFIRRAPLFGTLLACYHKGQPLLGAIDMTVLIPGGSRMIAAAGQGCWLDGERVGVSAVASFEEACILSGTVNTFEQMDQGAAFAKLRENALLYRGWGDAFGYYQVACGRAEVMVDPIVSVWDVAPMPVIFAEAGGQFSDLQGTLSLVDSIRSGVISHKSDDRTGLATNGLLHQASLACFQR